MGGAVFLEKYMFVKSNNHAIWGMLAIFILWIVLTDFKEADVLPWFAGLSVFAYLVYNAVRRWRK